MKYIKKFSIYGFVLGLLFIIFFLFVPVNPNFDFIQYFASYKLYISSKNPYDIGALLVQQSSLGMGTQIPMVMWTPPWVLLLLSPMLHFGDYRVCFSLWRACSVLIFLSSFSVLVDDFRNYKKISLLIITLALFCFPFFLSIRLGQIAPLIALGTIGIFYGIANDKPLVIGLSFPLLLIKIHLFLIFIPVFVFKLSQLKKYSVLLFCIIFSLLMFIATTLANPMSIYNWIHLMFEGVDTTQAVDTSMWLCGTLTCRIKYILHDYYLIIALVLLNALFWCRSMSMMFSSIISLALSFVFAPYGWCFDSVILLPAVIFMFKDKTMSRNNKILIYLGFLLLNILGFISFTKSGLMYHDLWWYPTGILIIILFYITVATESNYKCLDNK